jgi:hypothetical protein
MGKTANYSDVVHMTATIVSGILSNPGQIYVATDPYQRQEVMDQVLKQSEEVLISNGYEIRGDIISEQPE